MKNKLFLTFALAVLSAAAAGGAPAFDFTGASRPLPFTEVKTPAVPAPVRAARPACKPFLLSVSVGGVSETVIMERACTPENEPVWALIVEVKGRRSVSVKVAASDYPAEKERLEARIKSMVVDGVSQEDADFIVAKTGPALKQAQTAPPADQQKLLDAAREALKAQLARP